MKMDGFKIPSFIPQDLQIIQDIVGDIRVPSPQKTPTPQPATSHSVPDEDIDSSDAESDTNSEREVEANILSGDVEEEDEAAPIPIPSDTVSTEDDSSEESSSDSEVAIPIIKTEPSAKLELPDFDEEEDAGVVATSDNPLHTKNEVLEADITIPDIDEIDASETLEKVGEVMSIVGQTVIVIGSASHIASKANERALDSETLLVFDDRKAFGYIFETFGPTSQPLYQVKFNQKYPLDPEKVRVGREVFHVPARSNFVFVSQIRQFKGSDASNAYDEEPGEDEIEFSDDEQEQAYKRAQQQKRAGSRAASRLSTPTPSQMRDQDMTEDLYSTSAYEHSYNDMDFGAGPSRPPPMPYDDPYSDSYGVPEVAPPSISKRQPSDPGSFLPEGRRGRHHGRGRERGRGGLRERGGRGRGRGRGRDHQRMPSESRGSEVPRSLSPTSMAIARATGQYADGGMYPVASSANQTVLGAQNGWDYASQQPNFDVNFGYPQPFVQPHINPRFASAMGFQFAGVFPQHQQHQGMGENYGFGDPAYGHGSDYNVPTSNAAPSGGWTQTSTQQNPP